MTIQHSPLDATHRELGAKMVPFGGWDMPLSYPAGTLAEHQACRSAAVVFDVSHLGTVRVSGPGAFDALQRAFTNDLAKIEPGRCQYTHSLSEDGSVADDIIVWWRAADVFDVMPNASNTDRICRALVDGAAGAEVKVDDVTTERAVIAVQGPQARELLAPLLPEATAVGRFRIIETTFDGTPIVIAGTGYTGEDGLEIAVPAQRAAELWRAVTAMGIEPAGLGARDTLRLEAGLPLHGHELGDGITSLNADLEWVVSWTKGDFVGREALAAQKEAGVTPILRGLSVDTKRPPRAEMDVYRGDTLVGRITSGNISPVLGHGIAMAMIEPGLELGSVLEVDLRGKRVPATVVEMPFVKR